MAHATALGLLLDGLITSITGSGPNDNSFNSLRDKAGRTLKDQSSARTNQFAIKASYAGLVEKFEVVNRDALAGALQSRIDELPLSGTKYMPEILSLLLLLSNKPAEKTEDDCLDKLKHPEFSAMTWSSIIPNDSEDTGLWDDVERGYHSSGDEATLYETDADHTTSTQATSLDDEDFVSLAQQHVLPVDHNVLSGVRLASAHLTDAQAGNETIASELVLCREVLTMLHSLPTYLFLKDPKSGRISLSSAVTLATASRTSITALLGRCTELGSQLSIMRSWSQAIEHIDWMQSIQAAVRSRFLTFDRSLTTIERKYLHPATTSSVSLIEVWASVESSAHSLSQLSITLDRCVAGSAKQADSNPFALLENLYEETCMMQLVGDLETFRELSTVLTPGLDTYLRPIGTWVRHGLLPNCNRDHFLVRDLGADCPLTDIWNERYHLHSTPGGRLAVPSFLRPFAEEILATGKTKAFLRLLIQERESADEETLHEEYGDLNLELQHNDSQFGDEMLLPYSEIFAEQIRGWLTRTALYNTPNLQIRLNSNHKFGDTIKALEYVYFAKDGSLFDMFAESLFMRITNSHEVARSSGNNKKLWRNTFMLSELAQHTLGMPASVDRSSLSVRCLDYDFSKTTGSVVSITRQISIVVVDYYFSWPVQNITREQSPTVHQRAMTFLLQTHYAKSRLSAQLLDIRLLSTKERSFAKTIKMALMFRQRLLWFLEITHDHITTSSAVQHKAMAAQMAAANSIDDMAAIWTDYTKHLELNLLTAHKLAPVRNTIVKIIELCEQFSDLWVQLMTAQELDQAETDLDQAVPQQNLRTIKVLHEQFDSSYHFVVAGLRSIGRAGGESSLEMLAQRLDSKPGG